MGKRILFISGSIGLGHVTRDLAIARELRHLFPDVDISWLAAPPASQILREAGEKLLPESADWIDYTVVAEKVAKRCRLDLIKWLFLSRNDWEGNVEVFKRVLDRYPFDLIIGDETYEISVAVKRNRVIKKIPYVVIYDFIGMIPISKSPLEILGAYTWNKKWVEGSNKVPFPIDMTIFTGELEDIPDKKFGFLLPNIRDFARARCEFVGYILNMEPDELCDKAALRRRLGYGDEPLVICSIGGTAIGRDLLDLCARAYPLASERIPNLKMVLVGGPRFDAQSLELPQGVMTRGYIPGLIEHFAACDLAIVQGGGTTTLELTALRRPFLFFPLEKHSEQQVHVAGRLARHRVGMKMSFKNTTPETLAESIVANIGKEVTYDSIPTDGARNAALKIKRFLVE